MTLNDLLIVIHDCASVAVGVVDKQGWEYEGIAEDIRNNNQYIKLLQAEVLSIFNLCDSGICVIVNINEGGN